MPDTDHPQRSIDYLTDLRPKEPSGESKELYEKCCKLVKGFADANKVIMITPTTRSGNPGLDKHMADNGIELMSITAKREMSNSDVFTSVLKVEKQLKQNGSGNPPQASSSVPDDIRLILNKTRLGVGNGI